MARQLSFKVTGMLQQAFFFFLYSSWTYDNDFHRGERRVFHTTSADEHFSKSEWRDGDGGENNNRFFFFLTLFRQNKKEKKMRRKQNQQCKWNYEEKKTKTTAGSHWQLLLLHLFPHSLTLHREHWRIVNSSGRRRKGINFPSCNV